jgi:hypothetical protein
VRSLRLTGPFHGGWFVSEDRHWLFRSLACTTGGRLVQDRLFLSAVRNCPARYRQHVSLFHVDNAGTALADEYNNGCQCQHAEDRQGPRHFVLLRHSTSTTIRPPQLVPPWERIDYSTLETPVLLLEFAVSTDWTPSIVPNEADQTVYLVVDNLGKGGRVWCEADVEDTDLEAVILDLLEGQYKHPVRIVAFNTAEGWSQDASGDVAQELRRRCDLQLRDIPFFLQDFVDQYEGRYHDFQLPLPMRLV